MVTGLGPFGYFFLGKDSGLLGKFFRGSFSGNRSPPTFFVVISFRFSGWGYRGDPGTGNAKGGIPPAGKNGPVSPLGKQGEPRHPLYFT